MWRSKILWHGLGSHAVNDIPLCSGKSTWLCVRVMLWAHDLTGRSLQICVILVLNMGSGVCVCVCICGVCVCVYSRARGMLCESSQMDDAQTSTACHPQTTRVTKLKCPCINGVNRFASELLLFQMQRVFNAHNCNRPSDFLFV